MSYTRWDAQILQKKKEVSRRDMWYVDETISVASGPPRMKTENENVGWCGGGVRVRWILTPC